MKSEIEAQLEILVGQPLVGSHGAGDMESFHFGEAVVPWRDRSGAERLESRYSLHVQCSWRIVHQSTLLVGYSDYFEARTDLAPPAEPEASGNTLRDQLLEAFYRERSDRGRVVTGQSASEVGDLRLTFDDGHVLEIFPDASLAGEEHWRLIDSLGGDVVVEAGGLKLLPAPVDGS
jgi:hypothetical protein